ncbi:MAG: tetratricopeptide repeat protein [bacterium]|nr:tetratricopeptide repeat protein [bacterium]
MKNTFFLSKFFRIKESILVTSFILVANYFTFSQITAEDSLFQQANYYLGIGYHESAVKTLTRLLEVNPNSAIAYSLLGNTFSFQGKYEQAIRMYRKCIEIDSTILPVYENLGNAYIDAGKLDSAITVHTLLISKDSLYVGNYVNLGDAYMKKQEIVKAQECFIKAIDLNYYCTMAHVNLAMTYYNQKKYREAIDELFLVRNMDSWYPQLQDRLEIITETAKSEFKKWAETEPNNSEAHYYLAFFIWYRDDCDDAIDELDDAIEINNKIEKYYLTKAIWLHNLEEYEDAIVECKKCLALNPTNWMCLNEIAYNYSNLNDLGSALTYYQKAIEADSLIIDSHLHIGQIYVMNIEYEQALNSYNQALNLIINYSVKNPVIYFRIAEAAYFLEDYETAIENAMKAKYINFPEERTKKQWEAYADRLLRSIETKVRQEPKK